MGRGTPNGSKDGDSPSLEPCQTSFYTTFPQNCDRGESLGITTCPTTMVGGKKGHASCKIHLIEITRLSQRKGKSGNRQFWRFYRM